MTRTLSDSFRPCAVFGPADMTRTLSVLMLTVAPRYFLAVLMMRTFNDLGPADTTRTLTVLLLTVAPRYFLAVPRTRTLNVRLCP